MGTDEPKRPWRRPAVPAHEPVLADGSFEPGYAGDEHQHDQQEVGAGETGEPAAGDEQAPGAASEPRVSPVTTAPSTAPKPVPTRAKKTSAAQRRGGRPGRCRARR